MSKTIIIILLAITCGVARAEETNAVPAATNDSKSFRIITERNIFNSNRSPRRSRDRENVQRERPRRVDWFTLKGTMAYEDKSYAFFEGTSSQYRGALRPSDSIAGYKITEIGDDHIKLAADTNKTINLRVGMQMRRPEGGVWSLLHEGEASTSDTAESSSGSSTSSTNVSTSEISASLNLNGAESEAVKRMMLRRLQEEGGK